MSPPATQNVPKTPQCQLRASKKYYDTHKPAVHTRMNAYYQQKKDELKRKRRLRYALQMAEKRAQAERLAIIAASQAAVISV